MDTIPKVLNHVLVGMAICNFFLGISSWRVSSFVAFAAFLLSFQNASVIWLLLLVVFWKNTNTNDPTSAGRTMTILRPFLAAATVPTEFRIGLCLGISIGGTVLALFLSLAFRKIRMYCLYAAAADDDGDEEEQDHAGCGDKTSSIGGVWWWSTLVFWLDMVTCILLAVGRQELCSSSYQQHYQYESINDSSSSSSSRFQTQQQQQQQATEGTGMTNYHVGTNSYTNVPDVQFATQQPQPLPQQGPTAHTTLL